MMAATILDIPMSLKVFIAFYLACIWATAMYLGAAGYDYNPFLVVMSSVFWPLFLLLIGIMNLEDLLNEITHGRHGELAQTIVHRIGSVLHYIFLPFRPFTLGRKMADMCESLRRRKGSGK